MQLLYNINVKEKQRHLQAQILLKGRNPATKENGKGDNQRQNA